MNTILLIEDTKSTIDLINLTLIEKGYKVAIAINGIQGLKIANKLKPDLILLDILMPEMDGYEVCSALKQSNETKDIPIIFISALTKTFDKVRAFQLGCLDYISKPIDIEEMLVRIHTHITMQNLQLQLKSLNEQLDDKVSLRTTELEDTNKILNVSIEALSKKTKELTQSEERYKYITQSITDYIYKVYFTKDGLIETVHSSSCVAVTGYTKEELNASKYLWFELIHPDDRFKFQLFMDNFIQNPQNCSIEHRIITRDNEEKWVSNTIVTFLNDANELFEYNGIIKDITERKIMEKTILNSIIETEEKERIRFSQEIHDGIGPILASAKMYLLWAEEKNEENAMNYFLNKTKSLIEEAANASREIAQRLSPHVLQSFGLIEALNTFIQNAKIRERIIININSNIIERFDIQKETIIYRVLTESINNTLKHANAKQINISIKLKNNSIFINYTDDGSGFDFEKTIHTNKGMGLFNMRNRIEALNGLYLLESKFGEGTKIEIQLQV